MNVISIHAPAKGATISVIVNDKVISNFNPRSREGSDLCLCFRKLLLSVFQSTLPRRERHFLILDTVKVSLFQSTLPRRERQKHFDRLRREFKISIHAPAKGATFAFVKNHGREENFNPRSREGSDKPLLATYTVLMISIHAPAKGATAILYNKFHFLCIILYILSAIT